MLDQYQAQGASPDSETRPDGSPLYTPQAASLPARGGPAAPSDSSSTDRSLPRHNTVRDLLEAISSINDLLLARDAQGQLFTSIATLVADTFEYPFSAIVLFDETMSTLDLVGINHKQSDELIRRHRLDGLNSRSFKVTNLSRSKWLQFALENLLYVTGDPDEVASLFLSGTKSRAFTRLLGIHSSIVVPLVARGNLLGALLIGVNRAEVAPFEESDLVFLARHTAVALQMWLLYDRAEGRTALLRKLHTLSQSIAGTLDLDKLYLEVVSSAGQLTDIDFCTINVLTRDRKSYESLASWRRGEAPSLGGGMRSVSVLPEDWLQRGLRGEMITVADLTQVLEASSVLRGRGATALAVLPFNREGTPVGFITVGRKRPGDWSDADIQVFRQLNEYVSVAYTNAWLYAQATRRAERLATLHSTGEQLSRIHDESLLFSALYTATSQTVDATVFRLLMKVGENGKIMRVAEFVGGYPVLPLETVAYDDPGRYAIDNCETVHITREAAANPVSDLTETMQSALSVPLMSGNRALGALTVMSPHAYAYDKDDVQVVQILASHAAVSLDNMRLLREEEYRTVQQSTVARAARMIAQADSREALLQAILDAAGTLTMHSECDIFLLNGSGSLVCALGSSRYSKVLAGALVPPGDGLLGDVLKRGQPVVLGDWQSPECSPSLREELTCASAIRSVLAVPLQSGQDRLGVLVATSSQADLYTLSHLELVAMIADHAVIALEKRRLLEEAKIKAAEQEALAHSAGAIARLDIDTVLQTIVDKASDLTQGSRCTVLLHDQKSDELYWAAGHKNGPELRSLRLSSDVGIVGHIFISGESLLIYDMSTDVRAVRRDVDEAESARSFMGVALKGPNGHMGVLVTTSTKPGVFADHDLEILATFADHATIALSNAYLYNSLRLREVERAHLLHQVLSSQEAERRRMAVDIHDGPLQSIGVNLLTLDRLKRHMREGRQDAADRELVEARSGMSSVVQELRDVISDLRPALLDTQGLVVAAGAHLRRFSENYGIETFLLDGLHGRRLPTMLEITLYRLLQEAMTNIRKHAWASAVHVRLDLEANAPDAPDTVVMSIADNGKGFEPGTRMPASLAGGHIGLHSMQERVEMIGGRMEISSTPGSGTCLIFRAPAPRPDQ